MCMYVCDMHACACMLSKDFKFPKLGTGEWKILPKYLFIEIRPYESIKFELGILIPF